VTALTFAAAAAAQPADQTDSLNPKYPREQQAAEFQTTSTVLIR
jgi:hypothetical protein